MHVERPRLCDVDRKGRGLDWDEGDDGDDDTTITTTTNGGSDGTNSDGDGDGDGGGSGGDGGKGESVGSGGCWGGVRWLLRWADVVNTHFVVGAVGSVFSAFAAPLVADIGGGGSHGYR